MARKRDIDASFGRRLHVIIRRATLREVQSTLGHDSIASTSGYLHARHLSSSGLKLDPGRVSSLKGNQMTSDSTDLQAIRSTYYEVGRTQPVD